MPALAPEYLNRLGISADATHAEMEEVLTAQEARSRVLLKIPTKRAEGAERLQIISEVRSWLVRQQASNGRNNRQSSTKQNKLPDYYLFANIGTGDISDYDLYEPDTLSPASPEPKPTLANNDATKPLVSTADQGLLRATINRWASAIPHHEYLTLGSDITITAIVSTPIYYLAATALLESRALIERETPFQGEKLPQGAPLTIDAISPWEIKVVPPTSYVATQTEKELPAARTRMDCPRCQRQGEMWCVSCQSTGMILCKNCQGRYQYNCSTCDGSGQINGKNGKVNCPQCRATGIATCGYCREGWIVCATCQGRRKVSCAVCQTRGEVLRTLVLQTDYQPKRSTATVLPINFSSYLQRRFEPAKYENSAPLYLRWEGEDRPSTPPTLAGGEDWQTEEVKQRLPKLMTSLFEIDRKAQLTKHSVEVYRLNATKVTYTFEEKAYELWIIGDGDIYCQTSPVHEYDQKLAGQAAQLLQEEDLFGCLEKLAAAFLHTPNSATSLVVLNNCLTRLNRDFAARDYHKVITVAEQANEILGTDLAINFNKLAAEAASKIRFEYAIANLGTGIVALIIAKVVFIFTGDVYAAQIALISGLIVLILFTLALTLSVARYLTQRNTRWLIGASAGLVIVLATSIVGVFIQDDYLARQKQEGRARYGRGDYGSAKDAIAPLEAARGVAPYDTELLLMLGRAYTRANYNEKAVETLTMLIKNGGDKNAEAHNELGLALLGKGDKNSAGEHFRKAITLRTPDIYNEAYANLGKCYDLVYLTGSNFVMGRGNANAVDGPAHTETVAAFYIDKFEVTNQQYREFVQATKHNAPADWTNDAPTAGTENWPVTGVSLEDAHSYVKWRSEKEHRLYHLPSEVEWEYAARGNSNRIFPWGDDWQPERANVRGLDGRPKAVGSFPKGATAEGIEDLIGNAAEWVDSPFQRYKGSFAVIPPDLISVRGGSCTYNPNEVTAVMRRGLPATGGDYRNVGFRCALKMAEILKK